MSEDARDQVVLALLLINSVLLAMLELFFLPLRIGATAVPVSLLVAAVSTPWLVSQTGRVAAKIGAPPGFAGTPLGLWLLTVVALGLFGPGGDRVLPVWEWRGLALLAAGLVPGALVLGAALGRAASRRL